MRDDLVKNRVVVNSFAAVHERKEIEKRHLIIMKAVSEFTDLQNVLQMPNNIYADQHALQHPLEPHRTHR
jgi:hypothetical protein